MKVLIPLGLPSFPPPSPAQVWRRLTFGSPYLLLFLTLVLDGESWSCFGDQGRVLHRNFELRRRRFVDLLGEVFNLQKKAMEDL